MRSPTRIGWTCLALAACARSPDAVIEVDAGSAVDVPSATEVGAPDAGADAERSDTADPSDASDASDASAAPDSPDVPAVADVSDLGATSDAVTDARTDVVTATPDDAAGCAASCGPTQACCGGRCVDTRSSVEHCGVCDRACATPNATPACANGACAVGSCAAGFADCDGAPMNGCEVDTRVTLAHCGACRSACAARPNASVTCEDGRCRHACAAGSADCDGDTTNGCEVDTRSDAAHCGRCGARCAAPNGSAVCSAGACALNGCAANFADCDGDATNGCEVDTRTSARHCGRCNNACAPRPNSAPVCAASACAATCIAGFADCDGAAVNGCEVATGADVANCGACGRVCAAANGTPTCANGACAVASCTAGFADCDGVTVNGCEVDTRASAQHCGACGNACPAGRTCRQGVCAAADSVLLVDGYGAAPLRGYLESWGYRVTTVSASALSGMTDLTPYNVVAFMYDSAPADLSRVIAANVAGRIGVVLHRADALQSAFGMGASGFWQEGDFAVTDNGHYITSGWSLGPLPLTYTYKSILRSPSADARVLGTATAPALVVHRNYRRVVTPYYGHTAGMPWSAAGADITRRSYEWAAGAGAQ